MNPHVERMAKTIESTMKLQGDFAPMVEVFLPSGKIIALLMPQLGENDLKPRAILYLKALLAATNAVGATITAEAWMRTQAIGSTERSSPVEVVQVSLINRDGTGAFWLARVRRMDGSGAVHAVEQIDYQEKGPEAGEYATLFDGKVPPELVRMIRKEFANEIR